MFKLSKTKSGQISRSTKSLQQAKIMTDFYHTHDNRLSCVRVNNEISELYEYDTSGRRIKSTVYMNGVPVQTEYSYNKKGQLQRANNVLYKYDTQGFLIEKNENSKKTQYTYDDGHLVSVQSPHGHRIDYILNNNGQRIGKAIEGQLVEKYHWSSLTQLQAVESRNGVVEYLFVGKKNPIQLHYNGALYKLHCDQVGTPFLLQGSTGTVIETYAINSFGLPTHKPQNRCLFFRNIQHKLNTPEIYLGFAGGLFDKDTGLVHFGMREYMPEVGRFTSPDPLASPETASASGKKLYFTDPDVYGYCSDDPVNVVDRNGMLAGLESIPGLYSTNNTSEEVNKQIDQPDYSKNPIVKSINRYGKRVKKEIDEIKPQLTEYIKDTGKGLADGPNLYIDSFQAYDRSQQTNEHILTSLGELYKKNPFVPNGAANALIFTGKEVVPAVKDWVEKIDKKVVKPLTNSWSHMQK
ncbi:MAG: RHS repeat domain-containing protein [Desulfovibrio sp.]